MYNVCQVDKRLGTHDRTKVEKEEFHEEVAGVWSACAGTVLFLVPKRRADW